MKKILAFAGSNSRASINKQLALYTASQVDSVTFEQLDLNDFFLPIFSVEEEKKGFPEAAVRFNEELKKYDGFVLSLAEHNGSYAAVFKNLFDWVSRIDRLVFKEKPVLLMATSPGGRGGSSVLASASATFPHLGAKIVATFSLPSFFDNFKQGELSSKELNSTLQEAIEVFEKQFKD